MAILRSIALFALAERRRRLADPSGRERARRFLEREVWARVPADQLGRMPDRREREEIPENHC